MLRFTDDTKDDSGVLFIIKIIKLFKNYLKDILRKNINLLVLY